MHFKDSSFGLYLAAFGWSTLDFQGFCIVAVCEAAFLSFLFIENVVASSSEDSLAYTTFFVAFRFARIRVGDAKVEAVLRGFC